MATSRKVFIGRVSLPAITPSSLYDLMKNSALHWGFETTALTTPSFDSIIGDEVGVIPDAQVFVGSDNTVSPTTGISVAAGANFSLQDFAKYGLIDPNQIWFYNQSGAGMAVTFHGR